MADQVLLYISSAPDLDLEREVLSRTVAEVPVTLGWRVVHSPTLDDPVDLALVSQADVHLVLLGSDIRAPVGLEWAAARRAGCRPVLFLKRAVLRTAAAEEFVRYAAQVNEWHAFGGPDDLRAEAFRRIADHLLEQAGRYVLSQVEMARLRAWRAGLTAGGRAGAETRGGAAAGGVVLSLERYAPSDGILIRSKDD